MEWQPIETAPKDGTWVIVYGSQNEDFREPIGLARWVKSSWDRWEQKGPRTQVLITEDSSGWECDEHLFDPTHWMPLPSHPKRQRSRNRERAEAAEERVQALLSELEGLRKDRI